MEFDGYRERKIRQRPLHKKSESQGSSRCAFDESS